MVDPIQGIGNSLPIKETEENQTQPSPKGKKEEPKLPVDKVSISPQAREFAQKQAVTPAPPVKTDKKFEPLLREDKINLARQRLNSNFYDHKIEDTAESILDEIYG